MSKANDHGYVRVMRDGKRAYEHQFVWEAYFGPIQKGLQVHHLNGDCADNRIENLSLVSSSAHRKEHSTAYSSDRTQKKCSVCGRMKPVSQFTKWKHLLQGPCKPCKAEYAASSRKSRSKS